MYLSFGTLGIICLAVLVVWFWHDSLRARDIANGAAMTACERMGLQFLDGTAAFTRLSFVRDSGRLRLRRTYVFDYTAQSIERRQGFAILLGMDVEYVGFAPEQTATPVMTRPPEYQIDVQFRPVEPPPKSVDEESPTGQSGNNVFDLDAHRIRSRRK
jgi:hypothetical protein